MSEEFRKINPRAPLWRFSSIDRGDSQAIDLFICVQFVILQHRLSDEDYVEHFLFGH